MTNTSCSHCNDIGYMSSEIHGLTLIKTCGCGAFEKNTQNWLNEITEDDILFFNEVLNNIEYEFFKHSETSGLYVNEVFPWFNELKNEIENRTSKRKNIDMSIATPFLAERVKVAEEIKTPSPAPAPAAPPATPTLDNFTRSAATKEETPMENTKDKIKRGAKSIGQKMQEGAVQGMVGAANRQVVAAIESRLGDKFPQFLANPAGRRALELFMPALIMMMLEMDTTKKLPGHDYVRRAAELAVTNASADAMGDLTTMLFTEAMPLLQQYAEAGKMIEAQEQEEETPDFSQILERSKAKVAA